MGFTPTRRGRGAPSEKDTPEAQRGDGYWLDRVRGAAVAGDYRGAAWRDGGASWGADHALEAGRERLDRQIEGEVRMRFADTDIAIDAVEVRVSGCVVRLAGEVDALDDARVLQQIAGACDDVVAVDDQLRLRSRRDER